MIELLDMIREFLEDMRGTHRLALRNKVALLASSVAFFSIFSMLPFLILCFVATHYLIQQISNEPESLERVQALLESLIPSTDPTLSKSVLQILQQNAITDFFNIALCIWAVYQLFGVIQYAFTEISERGSDRNPWLTNIVSVFCFLVMLVTSTLLLFASIVKDETLKTIYTQYVGEVDALSLSLILPIAGFIAVVSSITLLYKIMPTQKIQIVHAFRGSILFLVFCVCGRVFYQFYAIYYHWLNAGWYGPFLTFIMVIVWIYFVCRSFLFAAQYTVYLEEKSKRVSAGLVRQ